MEFLQLGLIKRLLFTIRTEAELPNQVLPVPPDVFAPGQLYHNAGEMQVTSMGLVHGDD
jgi:hypothetical protein